MDNTEEEADVNGAGRDTQRDADVEADGVGSDAGNKERFRCWKGARFSCTIDAGT